MSRGRPRSTDSQREMILEYLQTHDSITALEALKLCGCFRLAAIIWLLRDDGYDIRTKMVGEGNKKYAEYSLNEVA